MENATCIVNATAVVEEILTVLSRELKENKIYVVLVAVLVTFIFFFSLCAIIVSLCLQCKTYPVLSKMRMRFPAFSMRRKSRPKPHYQPLSTNIR